MDDIGTLARDNILRILEEAAQGRPDPEAPQSYAVNNIEMAAIGIFQNSERLCAWQRRLGLDPFKGPDAVLGLGLLLTLDVKHGRRIEPVIDEDFEWPDEDH